VSEKIHFDFLAAKNYTSEGDGIQMSWRVWWRICGTRGAWFVIHSERSEESESLFSKNPSKGEIPHSQPPFGMTK
jgi:hypothetical protein